MHLRSLLAYNVKYMRKPKATKPITDSGEVEIQEYAVDHTLKNKNTLIQKASFDNLFYAKVFGRFQKIGEMRDLIPQFRDYYLKVKLENKGQYSAMKIVLEFQKLVEPLIFCPYPAQFRLWRKKWDIEVLEQLGFEEQVAAKNKSIIVAVNLRNEEGGIQVPDEVDLEGGAKTLAGSLINDAASMLARDQAMEDIFTPDELIKRRNYVMNVMKYVTQMVHGKEALRLKASAGARENAGFLLNLLNQATSGKITEETIQILKGSVIKAPVEETNVT